MPMRFKRHNRQDDGKESEKGTHGEMRRVVVEAGVKSEWQARSGFDV